MQALVQRTPCCNVTGEFLANVFVCHIAPRRHALFSFDFIYNPYVVKVVSTIGSFVLGAGSTFAMRRILIKRPLRKLFGSIANEPGPVFLVVSCFRSTDAYPDPPPGRAATRQPPYYTGRLSSLRDGVACSYLADLVTKFKPYDAVRFIGTDQFEREIGWDNNVIVIGSTLSNKGTEMIEQHYDPFFAFGPGTWEIRSPGHPGDGPWIGKNLQDHKNNRDCVDYAVIQKLKADNGVKRDVFVLEGLTSHATEEAGRYLHRHWKSIVRQYGDSQFGILLRCQLGPDSITKVDIAKEYHR